MNKIAVNELDQLVQTLDLPSLPFVSLEEKEKLPAIPAIYFAISKESLLYVGKSININNRWKCHHRYTEIQMFPDVIVRYLNCSGKTDRDLVLLENDLIRELNPVLNRFTAPQNLQVVKSSEKSKLKKIYNRLRLFCRERGINTPTELNEFLVSRSSVLKGRRIGDETIYRIWRSPTVGISRQNLEILTTALDCNVGDLVESVESVEEDWRHEP